MSGEHKIEALWTDVNLALDMAEDQDRRLKALEQALMGLGQSVFAIRQHLGLP
jgi:hypothetical protein